MKKNDFLLLAAVTLYSFLFYRQEAGINFLLFSVALIILLFIRNKEVYKNKTWLGAAAGTFISACCIALYGNGLSITANILSLCVLSAFSIRPKTSIITSLLFSLFSIFASFVFMVLDAVDRNTQKVFGPQQKAGTSKWPLYIIPFVIVLIFFFMYKSANPLFDNLTQKINFDFISPGWVVFTLAGFFLLYGFFYHKDIPFIAAADEAMPGDLLPSAPTEKRAFNLSIENENLSGVVLLVSLNLLLLLVNALDANFIVNGALPAGLTYSQFVHQGTGTLILSIIIAIFIILFYFRGELNFYKKNKLLKRLAYLWILQNAFMIFSTAFRNSLYIAEYSLTYKRIGVYVWLLLALIDLFTTFVKIFKLKSNWYLFRSNGWLFYGLLVVSCLLNWDVIVANYNIDGVYKSNKAVDKFYLLELSEKTLPQLIAINDIKSIDTSNLKSKPEDGSVDEMAEWQKLPADNEFNYFLDVALYGFLEKMHYRDWRSWNYYDCNVYNQIIELNKQEKIDAFELRGARNSYSISEISMLDNIKKLDVSKTGSLNVAQLAPFKKLTELNISGNFISSIRDFPPLNQLRVLDISENNISDFSMLKNAPNLEILNIKGFYNVKDFESLLALKKLKQLAIGTITQHGFDTLQALFPNTHIVATIQN